MTKTIEDINISQWFIERSLLNPPKHFVKATAVLSQENEEWIREKLIGRYSVYLRNGEYSRPSPAFEDPQEAVFYELTWA